jgi:hypothetical protein
MQFAGTQSALLNANYTPDPRQRHPDGFLFHAGLSFLKTLVSLFQQLCTVGLQLVELYDPLAGGPFESQVQESVHFDANGPRPWLVPSWL